MKSILRKIGSSVFFVFLTFALLYPNIFGNNPDIIGDESYFLTSALTAIQHMSLPGWVFSESTTYYGGVQTYIDTAVLVPAIALIVVFSGFSVSAAQLWIASNTGELLHLLRLMTGVLALATVAGAYWYFRGRTIPEMLAKQLTLFLFLLVSNVLIIQALHTAKMWGIYVLLVGLASAFFLAQEYYRAQRAEEFIVRSRYTGFMIWSGILVAAQSYIGAFSIGLLGIYALMLGHFGFYDMWHHIKRYWYLFVLFAITQLSFVYQAIQIFYTFENATTRDATGAIDWAARLTKPLGFTVEGQPFSLLVIGGVVALFWLVYVKRSLILGSRARICIAIAVAHPILTYVFFHVLLGLDILPRYGLMLTMACAFSLAILLPIIGQRAVRIVTIASFLLFVVVGVQAIRLYWQPSSEMTLLHTIQQNYNSSTTAFITQHSARRMTLPVNEYALPLMDEERKQMGRFQYLLENLSQVRVSETFAPIAVTAYLPEQDAAYRTLFAEREYEVWSIEAVCTNRCTSEEKASGTCFELNMKACGAHPQEVNSLPVFLSSEQLGYSYIVRKIR